MKNKTIFQKALSVFTAVAMALSLMTGIPFSELNLGITASAETVGGFEITGGTLDTDYTYVTDTYGGVLQILTSTPITIKNTDSSNPTTDRIEIYGLSADITLAGVNINSYYSPMIIKNTLDSVTITLADGTTNILKCTGNGAGLEKSADGTLEIKGGSLGTGSLNVTGSANGAGIGGAPQNSASDITISGGIITATGGDKGAGIGGGNGGAGSNITIRGGIVTATGGSRGAGIGGGYKGTGSNITISGGIITATGGADGAGIGGGYNGAGSSITISGGTVTATGGSRGAGIGGGSSGAGSNITISGGVVTVTAGANANSIGGGQYHEAADISGTQNAIIIDTTAGTATVYGNPVIKEDFTLPEGYTLTIPEGTTVTVAEGVTVTNNGTIVNNGTITNNGTLTNSGTIANYGTIDGTGTTSGNTVVEYDFTVTGGERGTDYTYSDGVLTVLTDTPLTIANKTPADATTDTIVVADTVSANITLAGVNIDVSGTDYACAFKIADDSTGNVTITLADGTTNTLISGENCAGLQKKGEYTDTLGTLTIQGTGALSVTGGKYGAGIGGGSYCASSKITISSGAINATGGLHGAGIGGGMNSAGSNITISDGTVTATAGSGAAGIGGGGNGSGSNITISGGTVTATGSAAGIGGGSSSAGSNIVISGGTVTATGSNDSAGIGGGKKGSGSNITISGGTVSATGGRSGAGIGGGLNGEGLNIIINGGSVKAVAGSDANAIGGGAGKVATVPTNGTENVYLLTIANPNSEAVYIDNDNTEYTPKNHTAADSADANLYVYLPAKTATEPNTVTIGEEWEKYYYDTTKSTWIKLTKVDIPSADTTTFTYNGTPQTYNLATSNHYTISNNATQTDAGTYKVTVTLNDTTNTVWSDGTTDVQEYDFIINPAVITITADDKTKTYGEADPMLTYTISEDTPLVDDDTLTGELTRDAGENVTELGYAITQGTLTNDNNPNYDITFINGKLTINPATPVVVIAPTAAAITYGDTVGSSALTGGEVMNGSTVVGGKFTWETADGAVKPSVSDSGTTEYTVIFTPTDTTNYVATSVEVTVTVNKKQIAVPTADTSTYTYNGSEQTYGVVSTEDYTVSDNKRTNAGEQNVTITLTDTANTEWAGVLPEYKFVIGKAPLTVTADSKTAKFGNTPPALTYTPSGLKGEDKIDEIGADITIGYEGGVTPSALGDHTIVVSGNAETANYTVTYINGKLTITEKDIQTITAEDVTLTYGDTNGKITATSNGDGVLSYAVATGEDVISVDENGNITIKKAGTATVKVTASETADYAAAEKTVTVTVNKKKVAVPVADTKEYAYTGTAQTYGVASTDDYTVTGGVQTDAGEHPVTITLKDENYEWDGTLGTYTFVIKQADVTITAKSYTIKLGDTLPTYEYDVTGLVNGEALPITVTISCPTVDNSVAGSYDIVVSGAAESTNYTYTYVNGTLTVSEKEVVAAPTFTPVSGTTFTSTQNVTIACATEGAKIYYTTDGTAPTTASTLYEGAITINKTTTIKAIAVKDGMADSAVVTATYTKKSTGGGGGGGGYTPSRPSTPTNPEIDGKAKTWADIATELNGMANGSETNIELNGNYDVPVDVIKAIAEKDLKVTFIVDSKRNWYVDGAEITNPVAADLSVTTTIRVDSSSLRGIEGYEFSIDGTSLPTEFTYSFAKRNAGKFANLYIKTDDGFVFVDNVKLDENGLAKGLDLSVKGQYVIMVCEFSDRMGDSNNDGVLNAMDASAILRDIVELEKAANPEMTDYNGDGRTNALDASEILKVIVGLIPDKYEFKA